MIKAAFVVFSGFLLGFLAARGAEVQIDLIVLLGAISLAYASVAITDAVADYFEQRAEPAPDQTSGLAQRR
jgi:hypothetical protein